MTFHRNSFNASLDKDKIQMRYLSNLFLIVFLSCPLAAKAQTASSAAPSLKKETKKALDKGGQNAYKHCSAEPDKDAAIVAGSCLDLAFALRNQAKDIEDARVALQRSCSLGNPGGCNELGKDLDSRGEHTAAVELWLGPTCGNASFCRNSLFYSLSSLQPLDRPRIVEIGMPLCDAGGDDQVCARLAQLGVQADYAAIAQRHREQKIEQLRTSIQNEDQLARSYEDGANQLQQQQTSGSLAAIVNATGVSGMKITAQNHRNKADSLRSELSRLTGQPVEIPVTNFVAQQDTPNSFSPIAMPTQARTSSPTISAQPNANISTQPGRRVSSSPGTLQNAYPNQAKNPAATNTFTNPPAPTPNPTSSAVNLALTISNLTTSPPANTGQYCTLPCPQGVVCANTVGVTATQWQQTTSYTVGSTKMASVKVTINMSDGSQQVIPMYVFQGSTSHDFTMNVGCSTYAPPSISATQAFVAQQ